MRQKVGCLCVFAALGAIGCGSGGGDPSSTMSQQGTGGAGADFITCAAETRATPYSAGMSETSISGAWTVKLLNNIFVLDGKSLSEAPAKGTDTWNIEVLDASGAPTDGVVTGVSPWMPDHRHGTTPVMVSAAGAGTYTLTPLYLYMAGYWEITVNLAGTGSAADSAMFPICVPD